ncbi:MAG: class I SAM-dependent methyltransferase [Candidatus Lokiarchaeia archaeon]
MPIERSERLGKSRHSWGQEYLKKGMARTVFLFKKVAEHIPFEGSRFLDLGCGMANISIYCSRYFPYVVGLDLSANVLKAAKQNIKSQQAKGVNLINGDALWLPFADETFDMVLTYDMYEHVWKQDDLLKEICRVIKPRGFLVLTTGNRFFPLDRHTMLWFIDYLPKKLANHYVRLMKKSSSYDVFQPTYWSLKKKIAKHFKIIMLDGNSALDIMENVYRTYFRKYRTIIKALRGFAKIGIFKFITPKFIVISQKL